MRRLARALIMLLVLLAGGASAGAWWAVAPVAEPTWPILIQQADGQLLLADRRGQTRALTSGASDQGLLFLHPTPAPDGQRVAAVAVPHGGDTASASLVVYGLDGRRVTLYDKADSRPFYLSWSPDSQKIAFLTSTASGMMLNAAATNGAEQARQIAPGQPSYFAWSPDSQRLLLHIGGRAPEGTLRLFEWNNESPQAVAASPALFQAPHWLPDGQRAFVVARSGSGSALVTIDAAGNVVQQLADVSESTVFVATPDAANIAYFSFVGMSAGQLRVLRSDGSNNRVVTTASPVVTCFWSPTGDMLAFLTIAESGSTKTIAAAQSVPRLQWNVFNVADGNVRALAAFEPTTEFINILPYFDQYAQSIRLWDRTGRHLLYATSDGVHTLDVTSGETQRVGAGVLGLWMER